MVRSTGDLGLSLPHLPRHQRQFPTAAVIAVALVAASLLAGCTPVQVEVPGSRRLESRHHILEPAFAPPGGRLEAWSGPDGLCLEAYFDNTEPDSGGCGFSDGQTRTRYIFGSTPDGNDYAFGPVPKSTVMVRLRSADGRTVEAPTAQLPDALAEGRYFFTAVPTDSVIERVEPLDGNGDHVEPQPF